MSHAPRLAADRVQRYPADSSRAIERYSFLVPLAFLIHGVVIMIYRQNRYSTWALTAL